MMYTNMCRICLRTDNKSWNILEYNLQELYKNLTGLLTSSSDGYPQNVCWECAARLRSAIAFRNKAITAYNLITTLISEKSDISNDDFVNLNKRLPTDLCKTNIECYSTSDSKICRQSSDSSEDNKLFVNENIHLENEIDSDDDHKSLLQESIELKDISIDNKPFSTNSESRIEDNVQESNIYIKHSTEINDNIKFTQLTSNVNKNDKETINGIIKTKRIRNASQTKQNNDKLYKNMFKITKLSFDQQKAEFEKRKHKQCYVISKYKCDKCYRGFDRAEQYEDHETKHTDKYGKFECKICKIHYSSIWFKYNHKHSKVIVNCKQCDFVTTNEISAVRHMGYHSGKRYTCPHCAEVFDVYSTYMGHLRLRHPSDIVCQICGNSYVSQQGLMLHKKIMHRLFDEKLLEQGPVCTECDIQFASQQAYHTHLSISPKHSKTQKNRRINRRANKSIIKEKGSIKANNKITCELCEAVLPNSTKYYHHFRKAHPGKNRTYYPSVPFPYMCDVCGKMLQSSSALQDHLSQHSDAVFPCEACGKLFKQQSRLREHQKVHSERRLFACALCGKAYTFNTNLKRHMILHTGQRPFNCEICGKSFRSYSVRKSHVDCVHKNKPWPKRNKKASQKATVPAKQDDVTAERQKEDANYLISFEENIN